MRVLILARSCLLGLLLSVLGSAAAAPADLGLFVGEVLAGNPAVRAAEAQLDAARARSRAAGRPLFNPELQVDAETAETDSAFIGLSQTIDWTDKRSARSHVAGFEEEAGLAELAAVRLATAAELLRALAAHQSAGDLEGLANRRVEIMDRFAALAKRRREAGDLNRVELDLAQLAAAQARLQQAQAAAARAEARSALDAVLGAWSGPLPALATDLPALDMSPARIDERLAKLPELRVQRSRTAAREATTRLRTRETRPDPTLALRGGVEASDPLVGVTLSIPLFVRNDFRAEVDAATADAVAGRARGDDLARRARARMQATARRYQLMREAWLHWEATGRESLESQVSLLQRLWQAGEMETTDYLVQVSQTLDTRASAYEMRGEFWRAWLDWLEASGQLFEWLGQ